MTSTSTFCRRTSTSTRLFLRTGVQVPLLDILIDYNHNSNSNNDSKEKEKEDDSTTDTSLDKNNNNNNNNDDDDNKERAAIITPLPSSHLDPELATPFLYGMQIDRPVHKLLLEEATSNPTGENGIAMYGHLVWKIPNSDSLVGAIGCTADILVNAPTLQVLNAQIAEEDISSSTSRSSTKEEEENTAAPPSETPPTTVLCRGGYRFIVKEVLKTIPYPVVIIDEIEDDAEMDDSDMFTTVAGNGNGNDNDNDNDNGNDHDHEMYTSMSSRELIGKTMTNIQVIVSQKVEQANSKRMSPLEQAILEDSGVSIDPVAIELMQAEEMAAVWGVFQAALVDDIEPAGRKFAIAVMGAEIADLSNAVRQKIMLTRDGTERLRLVLKELDEIVGMARARKMAMQITEKVDGDDKDLQVGAPELPQWAKTIRKGSRLEYFWNEEFGWCPGQVVEDPVTILDEILLSIRFDDGETHRLPLTADDKVRWRPG